MVVFVKLTVGINMKEKQLDYVTMKQESIKVNANSDGMVFDICDLKHPLRESLSLYRIENIGRPSSQLLNPCRFALF